MTEIIKFVECKTSKLKEGCILYIGGTAEKNHWRYCDENGYPFIMLRKRGNMWLLKYDFISMCEQGLRVNNNTEFENEIKGVYDKYWKFKYLPWGYGSTGEIARLTVEEGRDAAVEIFDIFQKYTVTIEDYHRMRQEEYNNRLLKNDRR